MTFWNEHRDAELRRLHAEDYSAAEIAAALGVATPEQVRRRYRVLGIPPRPLTWSANNPTDRVLAPRPERPRVADPDAAFAKAMAGRAFSSMTMRPMKAVNAPHYAAGPQSSASSSLLLSDAVHIPRAGRPRQ